MTRHCRSRTSALTYLYESRFADCVTASETSARLFGSVDERQRRGQAWQNEALCLWGMGRLPEAMQLFERGLADIGPEPVSRHLRIRREQYGSRRLRSSITLMSRSSSSTARGSSRRKCSSPEPRRSESLWDRDELLRDRGPRVVRASFSSGRWRFAQWRWTDADEWQPSGRLRLSMQTTGSRTRRSHGIARRCSLAVAPASIERIRIQLAVHVAAAGQLEEAKAQLDQVISSGTRVDPGIQAEALLQRAVLLRKLDRPEGCSRRPCAGPATLHRLGNMTEEFAANLELARTLRLGRRAARGSWWRSMRHCRQLTPCDCKPRIRSFDCNCRHRCVRLTT